MTYINIKSTDNTIETVGEFETRKEAIDMIKEYRSGDRFNYYYLSSRSTKEWREK